MSGYAISMSEYLGTPATAAEASSDAGWVLNAIHSAYQAADELSHVGAGYTRDMAYKALDAIRVTIQDDMADIPPDPSTPVDELALWWEPLRRDILMGWDTVKNVREKAGQGASFMDYVDAAARGAAAAPGAITNAAINAANPIVDKALWVVLIIAIALYFLLNTSGAALLAGAL